MNSAHKHGFLRSFTHAWHGVATTYKTERSFRFQVWAAIAAVLLMFIFPLDDWKRAFVLLMIVIVLALELLNSIFERLLDSFRPRLHPVIAEMKDMMAAAVLVASAIAAAIGAILFWPYILDLVNLLARGFY